MPREGIGRFAGKNEFSDVEFLEIFKELLPHVQSGEINLDSIKNIDMVEKMDSSFIHFGINAAGAFFMESSNSGEVTAADYEQRFSHTFMSDYKVAFKSLLENKLLQSTLQKIFSKVGAIRYDSELFPVLTHTGDESGYITFVATKYDKSKFGTKGALVVFKSWIKDENAQWTRPEPTANLKLIGAIEHADSSEWRIYTNEKHAKLSGVVQLKALNVDKMLSSPEAIDEAIQVLSARGNTTIKAHLKNVIGDLKEKLQGVLDKYAEETSSIFSKHDSPSSIEGVVLRIKKANGDIFEVKGTSNAFDTLKKQTWATRSGLAELEAVTEGSFLKDALGLKTSQAAALNRAIKDFGAKFTSKEKNPEKRENQFLMQLFDEMKNTDAMVPPEETKKRVEQIFDVAKTQLENIIDEFKSQKLDPDSKRKSLEAIKSIIDKFDTIEKTIHMDMPDEAFQLYMFKFLLDRRLKMYAGKHMNVAERDYSSFYQGATPVIIWNGRAQPWHVGHDAMIQLAKTKMESLGAEKILIMVVKGGKSSLNKDENPLTEKDQKALIEAVYAGDSDVVVSDTPLPNGSVFAIIQKLGEQNMYMVGWLAGDDRIEDYRKELTRFNASVWLNDHAGLPIKVDSKGVAQVEMIETPRVMSGTKARESAKTLDFKAWGQLVIPKHAQKNKAAIGIYKQVYELLNSAKQESVVYEMVKRMFSESVLNELHYEGNQAETETANLERLLKKLQDAKTPEDKEKIKSKLIKLVDTYSANLDDPAFEKLDDGIKNRIKEVVSKIQKETQAKIPPTAMKVLGIEAATATPDGEVRNISTDQKPSYPLSKVPDTKAEPEAQVEPATDPVDETGVTPEQKAELSRNLRKYSMVKDPEATSKAIKSVAGALAGGLIWAMKAENQKGGDAAEGFKNKLVDGYKAISDKIKKGKAKANDINKMVRENALLFQELIKSYRETKIAARKAFGDDKAFNERAAKLRPTYAKNAKELNDKATKAIESSEVSGLKYVFKMMLQDNKFQNHHQTLKKIMAISDKLKDSKKILDSYISELSKAGISIKAINQYLKDDDVAALAKNISSNQPQPQQTPQPQQQPPQKTP